MLMRKMYTRFQGGEESTSDYNGLCDVDCVAAAAAPAAVIHSIIMLVELQITCA